MSFGSIFKNIGNIFKTTEELEAEKRRQKRNLERGIEKSIDALNDGQRQAAREQEKFYQQGKQKLAVGRDAEARQFFQFSRMQARNAENYTRQKLMWTNALTQIRVATSMQTAAACFKELAVQCGLNPDVFENGLGRRGLRRGWRHIHRRDDGAGTRRGRSGDWCSHAWGRFTNARPFRRLRSAHGRFLH